MGVLFILFGFIILVGLFIIHSKSSDYLTKRIYKTLDDTITEIHELCAYSRENPAYKQGMAETIPIIHKYKTDSYNRIKKYREFNKHQFSKSDKIDASIIMDLDMETSIRQNLPKYLLTNKPTFDSVDKNRGYDYIVNLLFVVLNNEISELEKKQEDIMKYKIGK